MSSAWSSKRAMIWHWWPSIFSKLSTSKSRSWRSGCVGKRRLYQLCWSTSKVGVVSCKPVGFWALFFCLIMISFWGSFTVFLWFFFTGLLQRFGWSVNQYICIDVPVFLLDHSFVIQSNDYALQVSRLWVICRLAAAIPRTTMATRTIHRRSQRNAVVSELPTVGSHHRNA